MTESVEDSVGAEPVAPDPPVIDHGTGRPREAVRVPVMLQRWGRISFLHWAYEPSVVQTLLPEELEVETFDGAAWVGLVPFHVTARPPGLSADAPLALRFPETNVRTYVHGPDGSTGIVFFSLDAGSLPAVLAARAGWWLPYMWSEMDITGARGVTTYTCRRRWPGPAVTSRVTVRSGRRLAATEVGPFERYLTSRFRLYSRVAGKLLRVQAEHAPWRLREGHATEIDDGLVTATGLPGPTDPPLVHVGQNVDVRIGPPRLATTSSS